MKTELNSGAGEGKPRLRALPELLSPAGSPEALAAAIAGGADAVYLGGRLLNARMRARNFDDDALREAVRRCHGAGVRIFVTLNTIVYDRECDEAVRYAAFLYEAGADALIIADLGLAERIKHYMPDFELHASTQLSGHNAAAAEFFARRGFSRMVCARELSKEDIASLVKASPIEIEMFVHGALCVSHSGQCLCSWAMGGRSGNRGECAQPCRMKYNGGYPLSLKDNCLAGHIPELIALGVSSLKLEGRLKPPEYVYAVTSAYRKLLDSGRIASPEEISALAKVFSRGGFTDGYYTSRIDSKMLGVRGDVLPNSNAHSRNDAMSRKDAHSRSDAMSCKDVHSRGDAMSCKDAHSRNDAPSRNDMPSRGFSPEKMTRVGSLKPEIVLPPRVCEPDGEKIVFPRPVPVKLRQCTARFYDKGAIPEGASDFFSRIYLPLAVYEKACACCDGVMLPPVITDSELPLVKKQLQAAFERGARHALVGNVGHIALARERGFTLHGDFRLNIANGGTALAYSEEFEDYILSPELTLARIRDITGAKAVVVYGRLPLMLLEKPVGAKALRDERGVSFDIIREGGRELLINSAPIWMADKEKELKEAFIFNRHFIFTVESRREAEAVVEAYKAALPPSGSFKRIK